MSLQIIPFKSGINTCYILKDKGAMLIDGAWPRASASFSRTLSSNGIKPVEIQLIVLTHGDFDHVGGTKELKELTGAFPAVKADIVLDDHGLSLKEFGIPGKILFTPGHTFGSVSVLLETGDAFIGCLAHNKAPFVLRPRLPIYAKNIELLKKSWQTVLDQGARMIYPGHGKPFPVERILPYLN